MKPLNPKQLKFVERYLATGNATQSYIDAGYKQRGEAARAGAAEILTNPNVKDAIDRATGKAVQTAELTAAYVIAGLKKEAEFYGRGAQHSARIKAYELLGKAVRVWPEEGEKPPPDDKQVVSVETLTRILAVLGTRRAQSGAGEPAAGGAVSGNAVGAESGAAERCVPESGG